MSPGDVIAGRYRVERELGRGGMGAVYLAFDDRSGGRRVAVKVAAATGHAHEAFKARFEREARIGCALGQSKGFVRAFDWGEHDARTVYMAMDLVEGACSLDLRQGPLDERLDRLERAATLVQRCHALGIVHRDLKPANVLTDSAGQLWLADFGLAKHLSEVGDDDGGPALTQTGTGMGTPQFMPPEQFEDAKSADEQADVYALGIMLFVALTGRYPYDGSTAAEVLSKQLRVQLGNGPAPRARDLDPTIPLGLDSLCAEATHVDRARRTSSASIFILALQKARTRASRRLGAAPAGERAPASEGPIAPSLPTVPTIDLGSPADPAAPNSLVSRLQRRVARAMPILIRPRSRSRSSDGDADLPAVAIDSLRRAFPAVAILLLVIGLSILTRLAGTRALTPSAPIPVAPPPPPPPMTFAQSEQARLDAAVRAGEVDAMVVMAQRLEADQPVKAMGLYRRAAEHGHVKAMVVLALAYEEGRVGFPVNEAEALRWLEEAASRGHADAGRRLEAARQAAAEPRAPRTRGRR